jgi:hypothetical protein
MFKSLHGFAKVAAVVSALVLAGGYVATRAVPGLLQIFKVYGGEGGGRVVPAPPADEADKAMMFSSKSGVIVRHVIESPDVAAERDRTRSLLLPPPSTDEPIMGSPKSRPILGGGG